MESGKTDSSGKKSQEQNAAIQSAKGGFFVKPSLFFISLDLLVHAAFFVLLFLHMYSPDNTRITGVFSIYLVFALYNLIAVVGVLFKRGFGRRLCEILIIFDFVLNMRHPWFLISLALSIIAYLLFLANIANNKSFREKDPVNKKVYAVMVAALLIPVLMWSFPELVPKLHTDPADVTREAIEKNDVKICDKINSGYRDDCIKAYALYKNDSKFCELIQWDHIRGYCYGELNSNET